MITGGVVHAIGEWHGVWYMLHAIAYSLMISPEFPCYRGIVWEPEYIHPGCIGLTITHRGISLHLMV
jgi:hypothetical protein